MQISALIQVVNYLKDLSSNTILVDGYRKISELLKEASANSEAILREKEELKSFLISTEPDSWGYSSSSLYEKINSGCLFGKAAADRLDKLLSPGYDNKTAGSEINSIVKQLSKFSENIKKFHQLFEMIFPLEAFESGKPCRSSSILLYFEGNLAVNNISDLERYSRLWDNILADFCKLNGNENPAVDICNFNNGNIILEVTADKVTLDSLMSGISSFMKILPDIYKIRKIQYDISLLPLQNNLQTVLDGEVNEIVNKTAQTVAEKVVSGYNEAVGTEEYISGISRSLKQVLSFIEKGGKIEFRSEDDHTEATRILNDSFLIIKELEKIAVK